MTGRLRRYIPEGSSFGPGFGTCSCFCVCDMQHTGLYRYAARWTISIYSTLYAIDMQHTGRYRYCSISVYFVSQHKIQKLAIVRVINGTCSMHRACDRYICDGYMKTTSSRLSIWYNLLCTFIHEKFNLSCNQGNLLLGTQILISALV
jgi:hypothetical protein